MIAELSCDLENQNPQAVMEESLAAFRDIHQAQGSDASWVKHPLTPLTAKFIEGVLELSPNPLIIDSGCGVGLKTIDMAKMDGAGRIEFIGIDQDPDMIKMAIENAAMQGLSDRVTFICANIVNLDPKLLQAHGIHEYQAALTHVPTNFRSLTLDIYNQALLEKGFFLGNFFSIESVFYGRDMRLSRTGDIRRSYWTGGPKMLSHFYTLDGLEGFLQSNNFGRTEQDSIRQIPHPFDPQRNLLEALVRKVN